MTGQFPQRKETDTQAKARVEKLEERMKETGYDYRLEYRHEPLPYEDRPNRERFSYIGSKVETKAEGERTREESRSRESDA